MGKQPNKTIIGAFVVGAIALMVTGVLILGGGRFLAKTRNYVLYFPGSIKGLNVGAPVVFKGVQIGSVTGIKVRFEGADLANIRTPVFIEIESDRISKATATPRLQKFVAEVETRKIMERLVERGMRAQLVSQSLVTGQLIVAFDFHPDKPVNLVGGDLEYMELPTIPSTMEQLTETIKKLPLEELVNQALQVVKNIDSVVNSPDLKASIHTLHEALKNANELVEHVDEKVGPLASSIEKTAGAAQDALKTATESLALTKNVLAEDSPTLTELNIVLREFSAAARSISAFADYLQRHPESLLRGKGKSK
jgi:paraquat-inducible protein B